MRMFPLCAVAALALPLAACNYGDASASAEETVASAPSYEGEQIAHNEVPTETSADRQYVAADPNNLELVATVAAMNSGLIDSDFKPYDWRTHLRENQE